MAAYHTLSTFWILAMVAFVTSTDSCIAVELPSKTTPSPSSNGPGGVDPSIPGNTLQVRSASVEAELDIVIPTPTPTGPPSSCPSSTIFNSASGRCEACDVYQVTTRFWQTSTSNVRNLDPYDRNDMLLINSDLDGPFLEWFEANILNPAVTYLDTIRNWLGESSWGGAGGGRDACVAAGFDRLVRPADGVVSDFCTRWNVWSHLDVGYHVHWIMNFLLRGYSRPGSPINLPSTAGWIGYDGYHDTSTAPAAEWERNILLARNGADIGYITFDENIQYCFLPPVGSAAPVYVRCSEVSSSLMKCPAAASLAMASPISLIWEDHDFENTEAVPARFSLDPRMSDGWSAWRASGKAPLLVILRDDNKVTTATQLFGNWTFGGKLVGHKTSASETNNLPFGKPWDNGFEALGSLDADLDGAVRDRELARLGLWFDFNRDGVSDEKEVLSLESVGVTELRYKGAHRRPNGDLELKLGYVRSTTEGIKRGDLVDWYSPLASDVKNLVQNLSKSEKRGQKITRRIDHSNVSIEKSQANKYLGAWKYSIEGTMGPSGILLITDVSNGKLSGFSVSTAKAVGNGKFDKPVQQIVEHEAA